MKGISLVLLLLLAACAQQTQQPTAECASDNECVMVKADCCGCQMGGKSKAIPKSIEAIYNAQKAEECKEIFCTAMYACDESLKPKCVEGRCVLA